MRLRIFLRYTTVAAAVALSLAACQELPNYFAGDTALARVGRTELDRREAVSVVPAGVSGEDSVAFVNLYIDRWIRKQLKLREAEEMFSESAEDIDRQVEEYRQALLIRKLDRYYVEHGIDTVITDAEIKAYYDAHRADFRLDRTLVKGCVVCFDEGSRQAKRLLELMGSPSSERQQDFRDLCAKNNFELSDFTTTWVDYPEFLNCLPTLRSQNYDAALDVRRVQQMRDGRHHYYYRIDAVLRKGDPSPLERVRSDIRRILFNQRQNEVIREHEQALYDAAAANDEFRIYDREESQE